MTTRRESILAAMASALAATDGITIIYRSRAEAFGRDEAPALIIKPRRLPCC